jgi:hypothetical protein
MDEPWIEKRFIKKIPLENGLTLELFDSSRKLAGDRWKVTLIASVRIPVRDIWKARENPGIGLSQIVEIVGEETVYEKKMERHFIDEKEKNTLLASMEDFLLSSQLLYLSHREFPIRFIMKKHKEASQKKSWYRENPLEKD